MSVTFLRKDNETKNYLASLLNDGIADRVKRTSKYALHLILFYIKQQQLQRHA